MKADDFEYTQMCEKCLRYVALIKAHIKKLTFVFISWPFYKWGINIIGRPLPTAPEE